MSYFVSELPEVVVKPGKMINLSTSKMKAILAAVVLMLYVYLLLYFKTIYLKNKRLDEIMAVIKLQDPYEIFRELTIVSNKSELFTKRFRTLQDMTGCYFPSTTLGFMECFVYINMVCTKPLIPHKLISAASKMSDNITFVSNQKGKPTLLIGRWIQALKTERELLNVHTLDKKLARQMAQVDRLYEDY